MSLAAGRESDGAGERQFRLVGAALATRCARSEVGYRGEPGAAAAAAAAQRRHRRRRPGASQPTAQETHAHDTLPPSEVKRPHPDLEPIAFERFSSLDVVCLVGYNQLAQK